VALGAKGDQATVSCLLMFWMNGAAMCAKAATHVWSLRLSAKTALFLRATERRLS
jgi:hypothetical protein